MLAQLISEIHAGGTLDISVLARKLQTSPAMIEAMMEHLKRNGFLRAYEPCQDGCTGCSLNQMCDPSKKRSIAQIWQYEQGHEKMELRNKLNWN